MLAARLVRRFGEPLLETLKSPGVDFAFPAPARLAEADIVSLGMPGARADAVRAIARAACETPRMFAPSHDLIGSMQGLCRIPGIGDWTAQYIAMRALREPDAFPATDVGLMRAVATSAGRRPSAREMLAIAEAWRPWRAYAALHLWASDAVAVLAKRSIA